jgi:hypothetical protein
MAFPPQSPPGLFDAAGGLLTGLVWKYLLLYPKQRSSWKEYFAVAK